MFERHFVRDGVFCCDGVGLEEIVAASGTPCYVYSAEAVRQKYRELAGALPQARVCYSLKANPNPAIVRLLAEAGAGAEVSSRKELATALGSGVKPEDIVFVGPAKTRADLDLAVAKCIYAIVADSAEELAAIEEVARRAGSTARVLLRINTFEPAPEAKEVMVGGPSKFGFDEERVVEQVRSVRPARVHIAGIQVYSASSVLVAGYMAGHIEYVLKLALRIQVELGFGLECIDFGGGFGVPYEAGQRELDLTQVASAADRLFRAHSRALGGCRLLFESGRYLVAQAGVVLTRVVRVKESHGRVFAICDGGMNAFSRPVFMGIPHRVRLVNRLAEATDTKVEVAGPICTPKDFLGTEVTMPRPRAGDIVGVLDAGAYGYTMSLLGFMSLGTPAELLSDAGALRIIRPAT